MTPRLFARSPVRLLAVALTCLIACGGGDEPVPKIHHFEIAPATLEVGERASIRASFSGGEGRVEPQIGAITDGQEVGFDASTSATYLLTVTSPTGRVASRPASLMVKPGLLVQIDGLPEQVEAAVTVDGPDGFLRQLTRSEPLKGLKPGVYRIRAATVMAGATARPPLWLEKEVEVKDSGMLVRVPYPAPTLTYRLPGDVALDFILIPPGSFMMGPLHPDQTADWPENGHFPPVPYAAISLPRHRVTFQKAFYLAKFPTTIRQWRAIVPGALLPRATQDKDPDYPMGWASWYHGKLELLPALAKLFPGQVFRLPSEAEWEYALRAGTTTKYFWGDTWDDALHYVWTHATTSLAGKPWPKVGLKRPNPWGLHDMFSVTQWMEDGTHYGYQGAPEDGSPWMAEPGRRGKVMRGTPWALWVDGVWIKERRNFDSAYRQNIEAFPEEYGDGHTAIRLALSIAE